MQACGSREHERRALEDASVARVRGRGKPEGPRSRPGRSLPPRHKPSCFNDLVCKDGRTEPGQDLRRARFQTRGALAAGAKTRLSQRFPPRGTQQPHALHVPRKMTFGHGGGHHSLSEHRCSAVPALNWRGRRKQAVPPVRRDSRAADWENAPAFVHQHDVGHGADLRLGS
jgi:hypothetical protein